MNYYPDTNGCFGCSLANYFVNSGDSELAAQVHTRFKDHWAVFDRGIFPVAAPVIVRDLTDALYDAIVFPAIDVYLPCGYAFERLRERYSEKSEEYVALLQQDIDREQFIPKGSAGVVVSLPCIALTETHAKLFLGGSHDGDDGERYSHYIDNGYSVTRETASCLDEEIAFVEIVKR